MTEITELSPEEIVSLGQLASSRGMGLLLGRLKFLEDSSLEEIHFSDKDEQEKRAVARWRALRDVREDVSSLLAYCRTELEQGGYGGRQET